MQIISLVWGILAFLGMLVALIPCLGSLNWFVVPFAAVGLVVSVTANSSGGENRTPAMLGVIFCSIAVALGLMRLIAGCGIV